MIISLIAAVDSKNGIGLNGIMPWGHIKEDMDFFRKTTSGFPIVMGRITFESIGNKALPNRKNIVISSNIDSNNINSKENSDNLFFESSFENALSKLLLEKHKRIFIIGGETIYKKAIDYADIIYLTKIDKDYNCDRFFPNIDYNLFEEEKLKDFMHDSIKVGIYKYTKII